MTARRQPRDNRGEQERYASEYHVPVLAAQTADLLVTDPTGTYIDGTLGGGGHTAAILDRLSPEGHVIGIDRDAEALEEAGQRLAAEAEAGRFTTIRGNFADIEGLLTERGIGSVDGILLDLGISSHQIDIPERGFAFSAEGPLDMRMDSSRPYTAGDIVNDSSESDLIHILRAFGEEPRAHKVAREIVRRRPLTKTSELADAVRTVVPFKEEVKSLSRVFQALRIAVNEELLALESALIGSLKLLRTGGRLAVIAYHSLEDRPVKYFFRYGNFENKPVRDFYGNLLTPWDVVTRKAIQPDESEVENNPRSRSARLRVAEKREPAESGLGRAFDY